MINQNDVSEYLQDSIPEMKELLVTASVSSTIFDAYKAVKCLTDFTLKNAHEHNMKMLKRCLKVAENYMTKEIALLKMPLKMYSFILFQHYFQLIPKRERLNYNL